jgi:predicted RNase H-like HicB family nuclease
VTTFYTAIIEAAEDGSYGVFFPDVPGCTSAGDTVQEAATNAATALAFFFEDNDERPEPQDLALIEVDPDVKEIARVLVAAPETDGPIERYNVTLPSGVVKRIDDRVGSRGRSAFLAKAAKRALQDSA